MEADLIGQKYWVKSNKFQYPILQISPEAILAGEVQMLDVNFIQGGAKDNYLLPLEDTTPLETLRQVIAGWYVTLRTIAVVGLLSVLIYIGIRIIISSTASDRAKYKQRLIDWVVAFCLLFFMHYIMAATLTVVDKVNAVLGANAHVRDGITLPSNYGPVRYTQNTQTLGVTDSDYVISKVKTMIENADTIYKGTNIQIQREPMLGGTDSVPYIVTSDETSILIVSYIRNSKEWTIQRTRTRGTKN